MTNPEIESTVRDLATDLWVALVPNPETITAEEESALRKANPDLFRVQAALLELADRLES